MSDVLMCAVVRHCTVMHAGKPVELWPGPTFRIFGVNPQNPDEYLIGAKDGARPFGTAPKNAVLSMSFDVGGLWYYVERVCSQKRFKMRCIRTGDGREAGPENFLPQARRCDPDIVIAVQEHAYHWYPAVEQFMPVPTDADLAKAKAS